MDEQPAREEVIWEVTTAQFGLALLRYISALPSSAAPPAGGVGDEHHTGGGDECQPLFLERGAFAGFCSCFPTVGSFQGNCIF